MVQIDVYVRARGIDDESDLAKTTFLAAEPLKLSDIEEYFPFQGKYHFRYKVTKEELKKRNGVDIDEDFVWMDLVSPSDVILTSHHISGPIEVQAVLLSNHVQQDSQNTILSIEEDIAEYFVDIGLQLQEAGPREDRQSIDSVTQNCHNLTRNCNPEKKVF